MYFFSGQKKKRKTRCDDDDGRPSATSARSQCNSTHCSTVGRFIKGHRSEIASPRETFHAAATD